MAAALSEHPLLRRLAAVHLPSMTTLARLVTALMVVLLGLTLARLTWQLWPLPAEPAVPVPAVVTPAASPGADLSQVAALHLFGMAAGGSAGAPETRLNLTLRGVVATGNARTALAIIDSGGEERAYRAGDQLPGGAVVREIRGDRVLLERDGRFETLSLPKEEQGGAGAAPGPAAAAGGDEGLGRYEALAARDPGRLLAMAGAEPVRRDGNLIGYRLGQGPLSGYAARYGLEQGDVVTAINGIPLTGPQALSRAMAALQGNAAAQLTVERDGVPRQVLLPLQP